MKLFIHQLFLIMSVLALRYPVPVKFNKGNKTVFYGNHTVDNPNPQKASFAQPAYHHRPLEELIVNAIPDHITAENKPLFIKLNYQNTTATDDTTDISSTAADDAASLIQQKNKKKNIPLENILDMMSVIFAVQVIGSAGDADQITSACESIKRERVADIGFNSKVIQQILCAKGLEKYIPAEPSDVKNTLSTWIDGVWLQQTYVATAGHYKDLCRIFDAERASTANLSGERLKKVLCVEAES